MLYRTLKKGSKNSKIFYRDNNYSTIDVSDHPSIHVCVGNVDLLYQRHLERHNIMHVMGILICIGQYLNNFIIKITIRWRLRANLFNIQYLQIAASFNTLISHTFVCCIIMIQMLPIFMNMMYSTKSQKSAHAFHTNSGPFVAQSDSFERFVTIVNIKEIGFIRFSTTPWFLRYRRKALLIRDNPCFLLPY